MGEIDSSPTTGSGFRQIQKINVFLDIDRHMNHIEVLLKGRFCFYSVRGPKSLHFSKFSGDADDEDGVPWRRFSRKKIKRSQAVRILQFPGSNT